MGLTLTAMPDTLTVCRLAPDSELPAWATAGVFWSITRTADELSVVVTKECVPAGVRAEGAWRALKVAGPIPLTEVGVLASIAEPLRRAEICLFVISTFDTDYVLMAAEHLEEARLVLSQTGHRVC